MSSVSQGSSQSRRILPLAKWPAIDRETWIRAHEGTGPDWHDNPAHRWSQRTLKKNENAYGRYLAWLAQHGLLVANEPVTQRLSPARLTGYIALLKAQVCVSAWKKDPVGGVIGIQKGTPSGEGVHTGSRNDWGPNRGCWLWRRLPR